MQKSINWAVLATSMIVIAVGAFFWPVPVSGKDASIAVSMCRMFDAEMLSATRTGPYVVAKCDGNLEIKLRIK